jgi:hypothetical protein
MTQVYELEDSELCKRIFASITIVYKPLTLAELISLVEIPEDISDDMEPLRELQKIIGLCGSFLTP